MSEPSVVQGLPVLDAVVGSKWRWTSARCVDGSADVEGLEQSLRVVRDGGAFWLIRDQIRGECSRTIVQKTTATVDGFVLEEIGRIAMPATEECIGEREPVRPATAILRRHGAAARSESEGRADQDPSRRASLNDAAESVEAESVEAESVEAESLEIRLERARVCDGFGVSLGFEPTAATALTNSELARRYALYFSLGDASRVAELFAVSGAMLESFTPTVTGDPYRHDGRAAVFRFHQSIFDTAPWRGMRIIAFRQEEGEPVSRLRFEYMDPHLEEPFLGTLRMVSGAGEIFETEIELLREPVLAHGVLHRDDELSEPGSEGESE